MYINAENEYQAQLLALQGQGEGVLRIGYFGVAMLEYSDKGMGTSYDVVYPCVRRYQHGLIPHFECTCGGTSANNFCVHFRYLHRHHPRVLHELHAYVTQYGVWPAPRHVEAIGSTRIVFVVRAKHMCD